MEARWSSCLQGATRPRRCARCALRWRSGRPVRHARLPGCPAARLQKRQEKSVHGRACLSECCKLVLAGGEQSLIHLCAQLAVSSLLGFLQRMGSRQDENEQQTGSWKRNGRKAAECVIARPPSGITWFRTHRVRMDADTKERRKPRAIRRL